MNIEGLAYILTDNCTTRKTGGKLPYSKCVLSKYARTTVYDNCRKEDIL